MKFLARYDTLIAIIGTAILTAGYYWGIANPCRIETQRVKAEIADAQAKIGELPIKLAELNQLQSQLERQRDHVSQMEAVLPTESHVSVVLHEVASLARSSGLVITRLEPLPSIEHASYAAHPFHLSCRGAFDDVAGFLHGLETQSRLVTFGKVDLLRGQEGPGPDGSKKSIQVNIDFNVYSRHANSTRVAENTMRPRSSLSDN